MIGGKVSKYLDPNVKFLLNYFTSPFPIGAC